MSTVEPTPSAQEQLDRLAMSRGRLAAQQVLPWWWYVGWGAAFIPLSLGGIFVNDSIPIALALWLTTMAALFVLGRERTRRQGVRPPKSKAPHQTATISVLLAGLSGAFALALWVDHPWPVFLGTAAGLAWMALDVRHADRRVQGRIRGDS